MEEGEDEDEEERLRPSCRREVAMKPSTDLWMNTLHSKGSRPAATVTGCCASSVEEAAEVSRGGGG